MPEFLPENFKNQQNFSKMAEYKTNIHKSVASLIPRKTCRECHGHTSIHNRLQEDKISENTPNKGNESPLM